MLLRSQRHIERVCAAYVLSPEFTLTTPFSVINVSKLNNKTVEDNAPKWVDFVY